MQKIYLVSGIFPLLQANIHQRVIEGSGSIFTYQSVGNAGQTSRVQGSNDGLNWSDIVTFSHESSNQVLSKVRQHTFCYLKTDGDATLELKRGGA